MRAVTITGTTLARVFVMLGFLTLSAMGVALAAGLSVTGYIIFLAGSEKAALFFWGAACLPLVGIGLLGAMLPTWLRHKPSPIPLSKV